MGGLKHRAEFEAVAKASAAHDFWLEPTGGIDLDNYSEILKIALDAGVSKIIPHIYSSIIDKASGNTRPADVRQLLEMTKQLVEVVLLPLIPNFLPREREPSDFPSPFGRGPE